MSSINKYKSLFNKIRKETDQEFIKWFEAIETKNFSDEELRKWKEKIYNKEAAKLKLIPAKILEKLELQNTITALKDIKDVDCSKVIEILERKLATLP